jgi:transposase InsO family protein
MKTTNLKKQNSIRVKKLNVKDLKSSKTMLTKSVREKYYNASNPGSYSASSGFLSNNKFKDKTTVQKELHKLKEITLHKPIRKVFPRRMTITPFLNYMYEADLIDLSKYAKENDNNKFILNIINCFSRYAYSFPIKDKSAAIILKAFKLFFKINKVPFKKLFTDFGKEFWNADVQTLLKRKGITHYRTFTEIKAGIIERFNRTLETRLERYFTFANHHRYIDVLPQLVYSYNHTRHSSTLFPPALVNEKNEDQVWKNLYSKYYEQPIGKPVFKIGDKVLLSRIKKLFSKGFHKNFSPEVFTIYDINMKSRPIVYYIKDKNNERISGSMYKEELVQVEE